ncbi:MAG: glutamate--tRNA ligase [Saprospiraceae bacterium]
MTNIRVRFAPSPTGALHIGGVRTALYNYLLAKKMGGTFILRIEDTDQTRYVAGAEKYILEALKWCNISPDEGPGIGGDYGPYRQSERKGLYQKYAEKLLADGNAYYAFDTPEALDEKRAAMEAEKGVFRYDGSTRMDMVNSLTLSAAEVQQRLESGAGYTIRLKVPREEQVQVNDLIRGTVTFQSNELDDKIMLKSDGMPTYHLANIVDDHLMEISHVIRGEEWLPSTAHHVLLYRYLGWENEMPKFAHLPLILKPSGKGKLSKRDGDKLGMPVFPIGWEAEKAEDSFRGFREYGFDPKAVLNFLAFLGWNPGTEQEIFSLEELAAAFSIDKIGKSGARFDYQKAQWFNQQYIIAAEDQTLATMLRNDFGDQLADVSDDFLASFCGLLKERVTFTTDFLEMGYYFFGPVKSYEEKPIRKKWKLERRPTFDVLTAEIEAINDFTAENLETVVKNFIAAKELKFGEVFPMLRIALTGTMSGPDLFKMAALLGKATILERLTSGYNHFDQVKAAASN